MMAMLILWLKKIILLVLLATFLDLLLPNGAYSKYVKLVMGLLILLALLSPVLDLFRKDISLAQLTFSAGDKVTKESNPDFARVESLAKRLAEQNDAEARRYVQTQISELIKKQVEANYGVKVENVQVKVHAQDQTAKQPIVGIEVVLAQKKTDAEAKGQSSERVAVEPMEPVQIEIALTKQKDTTPPSTQSEASVEALAEQSRMERNIAETIAGMWDVPQDTVRVTWLGAREEGSG
ncbi:stage III sporulation protein AF [Aneurinibacillus sp. REN35]|uniref:stage III sporulation protein AF n=1 Tax=Aneurinibacillus sp. REN35 TaxID=3237286 RepID=UPI003527EB10